MFSSTSKRFKGISVNKAVVKPGETVTYSIDAIDSQYGIENAYLEFGNEDDYATYEGFSGEYYPATFNPQTQKYEVKVPINQNYKPGTYKVINLAIYDKNNNATYLKIGKNTELNNADFKVTNDSYGDYTAPVVNSISVDKTLAQPGDVVTLSVNATDDQSEVNSVEIVYQDINGKSFYQNAFYNEKTGNYEEKIKITSFMILVFGVLVLYL